MNIEGIEIARSEGRLPEGKLVKALSLIKILPDNTFLSEKERNKKGCMPIYMKADELNIEYSGKQHPFLYISSKNRYFGRCIGSISVPSNSTSVHVTKKGVAFTFNKCRYITRF